MAVLRSIREDLSDPNISQAEKKDLEQKKKRFSKARENSSRRRRLYFR